jgi:hypothetical protein
MELTGLLTVYGTATWLWTFYTCRPDLILRDLHLFGSMKKHAAGEGFETDTDMKQAVTSWLKALDTDFFHAGI